MLVPPLRRIWPSVQFAETGKHKIGLYAQFDIGFPFSSAQVYKHICVRVSVHTHTYIHTYNICTHTFIPTYVDTYVHTYVHTYVYLTLNVYLGT